MSIVFLVAAAYAQNLEWETVEHEAGTFWAELEEGKEPPLHLLNDPAFDPNGITGGTAVPIGEWEEVVGIVYSSNRVVECTGTLITPNLVLTAGHCVSGAKGVIIGSHDLGDPTEGEWIKVTSKAKYGPQVTSYDVGLLLLDHDSVYTPRDIAMDCIVDNYLVDGAALHVVGFGAIDKFGFQYVDELQEADIEIFDHDCSTVGEGCVTQIQPTGELIAGSYTGQDTCYGDSGGPAFLETYEGTYLAAVTSRGTYSAGWTCGTSAGGIYVRVDDNVVSWIETLTGQVLNRPVCLPPPPQAEPEVVATAEEPAGGCSTTGTAPLAGWIVALGLLGLRRRR